MSKYFRLFGMVLLFVASLLGIVIDAPLNSPSSNYSVHVVFVLVATVLLILLLRGSRESSPPKWLGPERPIDLEVTELRRAVDDVLDSYGKQAAKYFADVLLRLPRYLVRVDERLVSVPRGAEIQTVVTFRLTREAVRDRKKIQVVEPITPTSKSRWWRRTMTTPTAASHQVPTLRHPLLLPVFRCKRGERLDELGVADNSTGQQAPRLSRRESTALSAYALQEWILFVVDEDGLARPGETALDQFLLDVCTCQISSVGIRDRLQSLLGTTRELDALVDICKYLLDNYLIVAELAWPHANKLMARIEHFVDDVTPASTALAKMRKRFGLASNIVELPMTYAFQAQIYHFQLSAPSDQYVFEHRLESLSDGELLTQDGLEKFNRPYVRVYHRDGRTNAHCYVRTRNAVDPPSPPDVKSVVAFREIPPGALGAAASVAIALAGLIVFFAVTGIAIDGPTEKLNSANLFNSDIPAVLLALPAFAALLLGHWADQSRLPKSSLSAYSGLLMTFFLSFATALLFILDANRQFGSRAALTVWNTGPNPIGGPRGAHFTGDWVWISLGAVAVTHALYLVLRLRGELKYYLSLPDVSVRTPPTPHPNRRKA